MSTTTKGKGTRATRAGKLVAGARKHFANGTQVLTFAGELANVTVDGAVDELQKLIDNRSAAAAAQATARAKVEAERAATPDLVAFMNAFEGLVRIMFASDIEALADFGLQPRKQPAPRKAADKAVAVARAAATREARGTTSAKARKSVHGNITAKLVVTPGTASEAVAPEAPAPANAPAAGSGGAAIAPPKG